MEVILITFVVLFLLALFIAFCAAIWIAVYKSKKRIDNGDL